MSSDSTWSLKQPEDDNIHQIWENNTTEIRVEKFEDGTWDTFLDDRLIENYDTPGEAAERAEQLIENH